MPKGTKPVIAERDWCVGLVTLQLLPMTTLTAHKHWALVP